MLAAAYVCFTRHGVRRTTIGDIAAELGRTRPVVYRFVTDKNDAFRKVAGGLLAGALEQARAAATDRTRTTSARVLGILTVKLGVAVRLHRDSPHHADALLAEDRGLVADVAQSYLQALTELVVAALVEVLPEQAAQERAQILLALTRGLETDLTDPDQAHRYLRTAVELICPDTHHGAHIPPS